MITWFSPGLIKKPDLSLQLPLFSKAYSSLLHQGLLKKRRWQWCITCNWDITAREIEAFAVFLNYPRPLQQVWSRFSSGFSSGQPQNYKVPPSTVVTEDKLTAVCELQTSAATHTQPVTPTNQVQQRLWQQVKNWMVICICVPVSVFQIEEILGGHVNFY